MPDPEQQLKPHIPEPRFMAEAMLEAAAATLDHDLAMLLRAPANYDADGNPNPLFYSLFDSIQPGAMDTIRQNAHKRERQEHRRTWLRELGHGILKYGSYMRFYP